MKRLLSIGFIGLTLASLSCGQRSGLSESERVAVADSVRQMMDSYVKDVNASGLLAEFRYLDNSPAFFWVPPGYSTPISYDSVASFVRAAAPGQRAIDGAWEQLRIEPLSRDHAVYTGILRQSMTDTAGSNTRYRVIETGVVIRRPEGWKLLGGQTALLAE